jgi:Glycosyl transferase family 2
VLSSVFGASLPASLGRLHPALAETSDYQAWMASVPPRPHPSGRRPLLSLLMPVFDAPERFLREALGSLLAQSYGDWELCAADAGPRGSAGSRLLAACSRSDPRIRVVPLDGNGGIAANSNAALAAARGAFVGTLDQDDCLDVDALLHMAARLDAEPELDVVYSDMDTITPWGDRYRPFFKPDWSPELLLSGNYLAHLSLIRRPLVVEAGGFDPGLDGAQDWDLLLRLCSESLRVAHVPHVLYHWRSLPTSSASRLDAKPYVREAQCRAVQSQLDRRGLQAHAELDSGGRMCVRARTAHKAAVSIVSQEPCPVDAELLGFLDPRLPAPGQDWWAELALWALQPGIGVAGPLLLRPEGTLESAGFVQSEHATLALFSGSNGRRWTPLGWPQWLRNVTAPVPTAFVTRRSLVEQYGPLEPTAESVLGYAGRLAQAGLRSVTAPAARLTCPATLAPPRVIEGGGSGTGFSPNLDPLSPLPRPRPRIR